MYEAVGLLEVFGFVAALVASDAACKAANVRIESLDKNKPANADALAVPVIIAIKMRGSISDVKAGLEAAEVAARGISGVVTKHIIASPSSDTEKMLEISAI
jgi:Carbon dioxide concentrating mechanism/carboxysome shell protein